jgi:hypothetical protein
MASEQEIQDVINTIIAEGVGEGEEGMRRIAETIITRGKQRGLTPAEVVRERAQYTGYSNPGAGAVRAQSDPAAISAAQAAWALAQGPDDPTGGANHYFNPNIVKPSWANSMTPTGQYGGHAFYTDRPVMVPRVAPNPSVMTPSAAAIRQMTSPSGGNTALQTALDRIATRERNRVVPADAFERTTARNKAPTSNIMQAARRAVLSTGANQTYAGQDATPIAGLGRAPVTRPVQTTTIRPSASDLTRGNSGISTVASIPTTKPAASFSASDMARGRSGISTVASIPTTAIPDRLAPSLPGMPANYGEFTPQQVAQIGVPAVANPAQPRTMIASASPQQPLPRPRPNFAPQVATELAVTPPVMRPAQPAPARPPLRIMVNGANPIATPPQPQLSSAQIYAALNAAARGAPSLEDRITGRAYERSSNNSSLSSI